MTFFSIQKERILKFLEFKGMSKNKFYLETGISNGTLDKKGGLSVETIEKFISKFPEVNLMWLILGEGEMLTENINIVSHSIVSEPGFVYQQSSDLDLLYEDDEPEIFTNKNGNKFFVYPDNTIKIEVPLLSEPAYAGKMETFNDGYGINLEELPTTTFKVDQIGKGNYLAFTTKNNSMWNGGGFDTPSGAEVLGREVGKHLWENGFRKTDYGFILLTKNAIYHKDIKNYDKSNGMITLASRNPDVEDFEISINDIYQVFNVIKRAF